MKLEKQVTSVEVSNKLHKLGLTTPSLFFRDWTGAKEDEIEQNEESCYCEDNVNCYTLAELSEVLKPVPDGVLNKLPRDMFPSEDSNSAFAQLFDVNYWGKILVYLLENKLI